MAHRSGIMPTLPGLAGFGRVTAGLRQGTHPPCPPPVGGQGGHKAGEIPRQTLPRSPGHGEPLKLRSHGGYGSVVGLFGVNDEVVI